MLASGVVISGDITQSIADVDLVVVSLRTLIGRLAAVARCRVRRSAMTEAQQNGELVRHAEARARHGVARQVVQSKEFTVDHHPTSTGMETRSANVFHRFGPCWIGVRRSVFWRRTFPSSKEP